MEYKLSKAASMRLREPVLIMLESIDDINNIDWVRKKDILRARNYAFGKDHVEIFKIFVMRFGSQGGEFANAVENRRWHIVEWLYDYFIEVEHTLLPSFEIIQDIMSESDWRTRTQLVRQHNLWRL